MEEREKASGSEANEDHVQGDHISSVDSVVQNMALAHEIVMNADFKINEAPSDSIQGQVREIVHKAFWDSFEEDISKDPPNCAQVMRLLAELKEEYICTGATLLSLVLDHNVSMKEQVNNVLDLDLIAQQSKQGSVDIQGYATYIIDVMSKICTPARDKDIERLKKVEGLVPLLREIFKVLDLMKLDMANFRLSLFRPHLIQQSVEYEQEKFREYLKANPNGLLSVKQWLKRGRDAVENFWNERNDEYDGQPDVTDGIAPSEISLGASGFQTSPEMSFEVVKHSYVGVLLEEDGFPYPETLLMDKHRLAEMRWSMQCLVRVASILVVTLNIVGQHLSSDSEYKKTLKETLYILFKGIPESGLSNAFPNISEQIVKETNSFLATRGLGTLGEQKLDLLRQQITNLSADEHSIRQLIKKRVHIFLKDNLLRPNTASPLPLPTALLDVETELLELTKQFATLVSHNYAVFKPFYKQVMQDL